MSIRIGFIFRIATSTTPMGAPPAGAIVRSAEGYLGVELFANLLMMRRLFSMTGSISDSRMRFMMRMSVNVEWCITEKNETKTSAN